MGGDVKVEKVAEKLLLVGLGAFALLEEKATKVVNELAEKGKDKRKEIEKNLKEMESFKVIQDVEERVKPIMRRIFHKLDIPTRTEIIELKKEISSLKESLKGA